MEKDKIKHKSGKDKGGPSKGGFLNNMLCSYTVLYLCNEKRPDAQKVTEMETRKRKHKVNISID